jgi:hypothetical protein
LLRLNSAWVAPLLRWWMSTAEEAPEGDTVAQ